MYYNLLLILQIVQISLSIIVWFFFISKRSPLLIKKANDYIEILEQVNQSQPEHFNRGKPSFKDKIKKTTNNFFIYIKFLALDYLLIYYLIYTTLAIFGMFHPIFIAILLLDVFIRYPLLLYVVKSLWRPKYQILLTLILFLIGQYYFTLIAYFVFYQGFEELCEDLWGCYSLIFDQTFKVRRRSCLIINFLLKLKIFTKTYKNRLKNLILVEFRNRKFLFQRERR